MSPRIAVLKPLCSGIAIGSGGPFGAEGPIIMTGGAAVSLFAQTLHLTAAERTALPIVDGSRYLGMVDRDTFGTLREATLSKPIGELLDLKDLKDLLDHALPSETCRAVALRLSVSGRERLPVLMDDDSQRLVGIVSRSDLLKPARRVHEEEAPRERHLTL